MPFGKSWMPLASKRGRSAMGSPHLGLLGRLAILSWLAALVATSTFGDGRALAEELLPARRDGPRPAPAAVPPQDLSWFATDLEGGPVFGVGVSALTTGGRLVFAGGHETFASRNGGASWYLPRATGDVANLVAGPD